MQPLGLYVSVPMACFRVPRAREYFETFFCPPPATVYGMLLSMVGEIDRRIHEGAELAIALLSEPDCSVVLRTMWRIKKKENGPGQNENRRPDFQEILTDIRLAIWIRPGDETDREYTLYHRVQAALTQPNSITRFGGLSLGESAHLVDEVRPLNTSGLKGQLLIIDDEGDLSLPVWPDHVGSFTRWGQYHLEETDLSQGPPTQAWTTIKRPERV